MNLKHGKSLSITQGYLTGKLLIAMPYLEDSQFYHAVIYICGHDKHGAIGLMINRALPSFTFTDLLKQLGITVRSITDDCAIYYGGPVEVSRGFVLHTDDYTIDSTVSIDGDDRFGITSTLEILRALAHGSGPKKSLICLGYTGWGPGQLEQEVQENSWLVAEPTETLLFGTNADEMWRSSLASIKVDPLVLSIQYGHA
ncbi:MAG: YqgE/AlgH family protein [Alphaproteobacteria bacterium]|nr:YqgE/AlgH family protein [Alphaproteobacteria bacterium]